ncbi:helix-turn-helix domain-containing protein [Plantactinospora solaniradicis]|uniref:Helix-turn-helix domain-containing protein n=1 Tax=Plantactinospora solaniradicis TaxID=1723736 RepID=A0ABW1K1G8_9ACTN
MCINFLVMTDPLAAEARRLRTVELLSTREIQRRLRIGKDRLAALLRDVPPPEWTKRPNAKDELRARAIQLRGTGWSVPDIAVELGVARSTAYQWVRHLPLDADPAAAARRRQEHSRRMTDARWAPHRAARDAARAETVKGTADWVKALRHRELVLVGAAIYWCEGAKAKPWRPNDCRIKFVNSDPGLILLFLRFLEALGVRRATLRFQVSIHESADVAAASGWWADLIGVSTEGFRRPSLKKHRPTTNRRNTGEGYRGCLVIEVPRSSRLYWKIEGIIRGMTDEDRDVGR